MCYLALQPLKTYLHYHNAYNYQTWQDGHLPWEAPTHKVTRIFDHVVFQDDVTNLNHYTSTATAYNHQI